MRSNSMLCLLQSHAHYCHHHTRTASQYSKDTIMWLSRSSMLNVVIVLIAAGVVCAKDGKARDKSIKINGKDMTRKSIVFDKDTPDVFYCIPNKPTGEDKIIVR